MKAPIVILASLLAATAFATMAADAPMKAPATTATKAPAPAKELTPQQKRFGECSTASKGLKGDDHKKFMSECPKGTEAPAEMRAHWKGAMAGKPTQQDKMKTCNADAGKKNLKGEERKKFMSECLKG